MKAIIFIDFDNFCNSVKEANPDRREKVGSFAKFIVKHLSEKGILQISLQDVLRTYVYTGEFTDSLITRIRKQGNEFQGILDYAIKQQIWQKKFFDIAIGFESFEVRTKPLQFEKGKIFQKGIDVQIAVDMIAHSYNNSCDVVILCSGDVDLIESIKLVKSLGKKVVICSAWKTSAKNIRKEADIFIDFTKLQKEDLDLFTVVHNSK
ncbi:MAG: NYN domain-containing protein [archaeon]